MYVCCGCVVWPDHDECETDNGGCAQVCENTAGGHSCSCDAGYVLNVDGAACDDVDECADGSNGGCAGVCENTAGGYSCSCEAGYELNADGATCDDVNECDNGSNGGCAQVCENTAGGHSCSCDAGYVLNVDGAACDDVDECEGVGEVCLNGGSCVDGIATYTCDCTSGWYGADCSAGKCIYVRLYMM